MFARFFSVFNVCCLQPHSVRAGKKGGHTTCALPPLVSFAKREGLQAKPGLYTSRTRSAHHDDKTTASIAICLLASPRSNSRSRPFIQAYLPSATRRCRDGGTFLSHSRPYDALQVLIVSRGLCQITNTHWPSQVPATCRALMRVGLLSQ